MVEIQPRFMLDLGFWENLQRSLSMHYRTARKGIILIGTTWGAQRFIAEEKIFSFMMGLFGFIFATVIGSILYDGYYLRLKRIDKESKKIAAKKNQ